MAGSMTALYTIGCVINLIPGFPPGVKFEDTYFQLLPVDKTKCPAINPVTEIRFEVYTSFEPTQSYRVRIGDDYSLTASRLNFSLPTIVFFHAFFEDTFSPTSVAIRQGFLAKGGYNLIFVYAQKLLAGPWYKIAAQNTAILGQYSALFLDYLVSRGLNLKTLHLIGLSLGGQTAGVCGHFMKTGKPARITGLDPAGPLFTKFPKSLRLDVSDAEFVDVIHTNAAVFGYPDSIGHVDFWPNNGRTIQPGCRLKDVRKRNPGAVIEKLFCSHWRSYEYFAESITKPNSFLASQCDSWKQFQQRRCSKKTIPMGLSTPSYARGNYYLETNAKPPFSKV